MYMLWYVLCCYLNSKPPTTTTTKGSFEDLVLSDAVTLGDTQTFKHLGQLK